MGRRGVLALLVGALALGGCAVAQTVAADTVRSPARTAAVNAREVPAALTAPRAAVKKKKVNRCAQRRAAKIVVVSIGRQHAWMCAHHRTAFQTAVTTGMTGPYTQTPTGHFRIQGRSRDTVLTLNTGAQYHVKYWIPFQAPLFGFHDAPWQHFRYGSPKYKTRGSHGCIHMPIKAMRFLYKWGSTGTPVIIRS